MKTLARLVLSVIAAPAILAACSPAGYELRNSAPAADNNNTTSGVGAPVVCQPNPPSTGTSINGLEGKMYYLDAGAAPLTSVNDYISTGHLAPNTFFFNVLDIPTEVFTAGFPTQDGTLIKDPQGNVLTTNFALDLQTTIVLSPSDTAGDYQFAFISDDGAILSAIDSSKNNTVILNNDGLNASKFGCAKSVVHFDANTRLQSEIKYYQGPATQIALILMWRKITNNVMDDTYCGDSGNGTFFNSYANPPTPTAEYNAVLAKGWAPLKANNYVLPNAATNPCI